MSVEYVTRDEMVKGASDVILDIANDGDYNLLHFIEYDNSNKQMYVYITLCFALYFLLHPNIKISFLYSWYTHCTFFFGINSLLGCFNIEKATTGWKIIHFYSHFYPSKTDGKLHNYRKIVLKVLLQIL